MIGRVKTGMRVGVGEGVGVGVGVGATYCRPRNGKYPAGTIVGPPGGLDRSKLELKPLAVYFSPVSRNGKTKKLEIITMTTHAT